MLTLALGATLVGFALLVVGLITGTVWLAVACIVVCLLGLAFLIADIIGAGRRRDNDAELADFVDRDDARSDRRDEGRARQPGSETGPADGVGTASGGDYATAATAAGPSRHRRGDAEPGTGDETTEAYATERYETEAYTPGGYTAETVSVEQTSETGTGRSGSLDDYLRSVGAETGAQPSAGRTEAFPTSAPPRPEPTATQFPRSDSPYADLPGAAPGPTGDTSAPDAPRGAPADPSPGDAGYTWGAPTGQNPGQNPGDQNTERSDPSTDSFPAQRSDKIDPLDPRWRPPAD
ncbi:hypothetical protein GCM10009624_33450 [Gordonia sinesedis]